MDTSVTDNTQAQDEMPKDDALHRLIDSAGQCDMPECETFGLIEGADLMEVIEECQAWRESHKGTGNFNPNWCAARDALKEHLQFCSSNKSPAHDLAALERVREWVIKLNNEQAPITPGGRIEVYDTIRALLDVAIANSKK